LSKALPTLSAVSRMGEKRAPTTPRTGWSTSAAPSWTVCRGPQSAWEEQSPSLTYTVKSARLTTQSAQRAAKPLAALDFLRPMTPYAEESALR
jgi:hypothetical protein